jgi:hypothetical protein
MNQPPLTVLADPHVAPAPHDRVLSGATIVIPVCNDWSALRLLLCSLDTVAGGCDHPLAVLIVDDGSATPPPPGLVDPHARRHLASIELLTLKRNLGHQRAIAVGLAHLQQRGRRDTVVVMDGDGEDDPADVPRLLKRAGDLGLTSVVFAERTTRSEGLGFRAGYFAYRMLHRLATGRVVRIGNFSALPPRCLEPLAVSPELWNHFAATVIRSRMPFELVPTCRRKRLDGRSRMNFVSLVIHGLSSLSVFGDVVGVRLLVATAALSGLFGLLAGGAAFLPATPSPWAGAAPFLLGGLAVLGLHTVVIEGLVLLVILDSRSRGAFIPARDAPQFVLRSEVLHETPREKEDPRSRLGAAA